jgi:hypothetical protein
MEAQFTALRHRLTGANAGRFSDLGPVQPFVAADVDV